MDLLILLCDEAKQEGIMSFNTALLTAVAALFTALGVLARYIQTLHKAYGKKINELYDARINDLSSHSSLASTLEDVTYRERGTRKHPRGEKEDEDEQ